MQLMTSPAPGVSAFPSADGNLLSWRATIEGPDDTPYAGLTFKLSFEFPSNYPYAPPTVLFRTPIYHPNVDFSGRICLDILKDKWTAAYNTQTVLLSLQSLLGEPNKYALCLLHRAPSVSWDSQANLSQFISAERGGC
jgi:ubiquitin-conjugating enzyme E2 C